MSLLTSIAFCTYVFYHQEQQQQLAENMHGFNAVISN
jgi:hypothetical protein